MKEAAVGAATGETSTAKPAGFQTGDIVTFLRHNADLAAHSKTSRAARDFRDGGGASDGMQPCASWLPRWKRVHRARLEDLERRLTVLEEKLFAALLAATPDDDIVQVRAEADRELSPYRRKMPAAQIDQLQKQYLHKRLLEKYGLPRLSLFYM